MSDISSCFLGADSAVTFAAGKSLIVHEWSGSGPAFMHLHHSDDEIWHVLEGALMFRIGEETREAPAGTTVMVPAGIPHTYWEKEPSRYLIILSHNLNNMISELHATGGQNLAETLAKYDSELIAE